MKASVGCFGSFHWSIAILPAPARAHCPPHHERKRPPLGSVPNPDRASDPLLASQPSDRMRRETFRVLDGAMGSQEILQDTRGRKAGTDGRITRTQSDIAVSRLAGIEREKRRPCMRNGCIGRPLHELCRLLVLHVRMQPKSAFDLPLTAAQNKRCFQDWGMRDLG